MFQCCSRRGRGLDRQGAPWLRSIPISQPHDPLTAYFDPAICADREIVGRSHRIGPPRLRNPLDAPHQGDADLPANQESRAVQLLLGHTKLESTVRYLGIEVDDALKLSEQTEV
jgi:hypothetical protein